MPNDSPTPAQLDRALRANAALAAPYGSTLTYEKLYPDVQLPERGSASAAGYDLRAYLLGTPVQLRNGPDVVRRGPDPEADTIYIDLLPGAHAIIPTGFKVAVPEGYEMQIRPRSGTSFKSGLAIANAPGTIDSDYRGEVGILVKNTGSTCLRITHGERIAQAVFAAVAHFAAVEGVVDATARGAGGFGSSGTR